MGLEYSKEKLPPTLPPTRIILVVKLPVETTPLSRCFGTLRPKIFRGLKALNPERTDIEPSALLQVRLTNLLELLLA